MSVAVVAVVHVTMHVPLNEVFVGVAVPTGDRGLVGVSMMIVVVAVAVLVGQGRVVVEVEVAFGEEEGDAERHGQSDKEVTRPDRIAEGRDGE